MPNRSLFLLVAVLAALTEATPQLNNLEQKRIALGQLLANNPAISSFINDPQVQAQISASLSQLANVQLNVPQQQQAVTTTRATTRATTLRPVTGGT
jgi:hypothetical protein